MILNCLGNVSKLLGNFKYIGDQSLQQVRNKYVNALMLRDVKRRQLVVQYTPLRTRINALRKNNILPPELKQIADSEIAALPRNSSFRNLTYRCVLTSRPRGNVWRWRLSRIVFRDLSDHNLLAGVQRAIW